MLKNLASNKKFKKISRIFKFRHFPLNTYIFYKTFLCTPYSILAWVSLDSDNIFFLNKLLREFGSICFSSASSSRFDLLGISKSILSAKPIVSFNFSNLIHLKKFIKIVAEDNFLMNKNTRFHAAFIKLGSNILGKKFFNINFNIKFNRRLLFKKIIKVSLYNHKVYWTALRVSLFNYFVIILKTFYFYMIICQLYTK